MEKNQNQGQHKGLVDYANSLLNLRQGASLALRGAATGIGSTAIWATGIALGALFLTFSIATFFGGQGAASEVTTTPLENTQDISNLFNITGATQTEIQTVSDALSLGLSFPGYKKNFTASDPVSIVFEQNLTWDGGSVNGLVLAGNKITVRSGLSQDKLKYTILHETGHLIIFRGRAYQQYSLSDLRQADPDCYSPLGYLKTYPFANTGGGGGVPVESFAESVSQFLLNRNFSTECPSTYSWMLNNVFRETQ